MNFFHSLTSEKKSPIKSFFTAFIAVSANLALVSQTHRESYIFQQFLAVTPRIGRNTLVVNVILSSIRISDEILNCFTTVNLVMVHFFLCLL